VIEKWKGCNGVYRSKLPYIHILKHHNVNISVYNYYALIKSFIFRDIHILSCTNSNVSLMETGMTTWSPGPDPKNSGDPSPFRKSNSMEFHDKDILQNSHCIHQRGNPG
jgi:hypothetical protein